MNQKTICNKSVFNLLKFVSINNNTMGSTMNSKYLNWQQHRYTT